MKKKKKQTIEDLSVWLDYPKNQTVPNSCVLVYASTEVTRRREKSPTKIIRYGML